MLYAAFLAVLSTPSQARTWLAILPYACVALPVSKVFARLRRHVANPPRIMTMLPRSHVAFVAHA